MAAPQNALGPDGWAILDLVQVRTDMTFGSGLLVGTGIVLTALHCVADPDNGWASRQIIAINLWRDLFGLDGTEPDEESYRATIVWQPKVIAGKAPADIAVLSLKPRKNKPMPGPRRVGPFTYAELGMTDSDVVTTGFPALLEAAPLKGERGEGAFAGRANLFQRSPPTISFTSRLITSDSGWEPWQGLSGGPLFRGDAVVGVMRGGQPQFKVDRNLEAEPLAPLLRDPQYEELNEYLGAQEEFEGPFSPETLSTLKRYITEAGLKAKAVRDAYIGSHVTAAAPAEARPGLNSALVDEVAAHGAAAMMKFLARLIVDNPGAGAKIEAWAATHPEVDLRQLDTITITPRNAEPVVLIKVMVTGETEHVRSYRDRTYVLEGWVFGANGKPRRIDPGDEIREIKHGFSKLPEVIQNFVTRSLETLPTSSVPTVELALPFDLLNEGVERWLVKARHVQRPLGMRFPLALRSYERLYDQEYEDIWYDWRQSWNGLPTTINEETLHWMLDPEAWKESLYDAINGRSMICVALHCGGASGIGLLVDAGASVAIWLRDAPGDEAVARAQLRALICGSGIRGLPERIQRQRRENPGAAAWDGVALFYDDPNHLPPDAQGGRFHAVD